MWILSDGKYTLKSESISMDSFNYYKQSLQSTRLYSKCLSGSTYIHSKSLNDIYDLGVRKSQNWFVTNSTSPYSIPTLPASNPYPITEDTINEYKSFIYEYGNTNKNLFTPNRLMNDSMRNYIYCDIATTDRVDILNVTDIDGIILVEGHMVLVKDNKETIILNSTIDPDTYFDTTYEIINDFGSVIEYSYYTNENGIYLFENNQLVRKRLTYEESYKLSINVKLGSNTDKQFFLKRKNNGYYPTMDDSMFFEEGKNWLIRNKVMYNNLFELNYNSVIDHDSYTYVYKGFTYKVPIRNVAVGDFGVIRVTQSSYSITTNMEEMRSKVLVNKYKNNLNSISQTKEHYFIVGDNGLVLRLRKYDLHIEKIEVDCKCPNNYLDTNLQSISFLDDLNGVIVGDLNTIITTNDGGLTWNRIRIPIYNSRYYTDCVFYNVSTFIVCGDDGLVLEFRNSSTGWKAFKKLITQPINNENYILNDNVNSVSFVNDNIIFTCNSSILFTYNITANSINLVNINDNIYGDLTESFSTIQGVDIITYFTSSKLGLCMYNWTYNTASVVSNVLFPNFIGWSNLNGLNIASYNLVFNWDLSLPITSIDDIDPAFISTLRSKMLFLDYDIASKLTFFKDDKYRLPNTLNIDVNVDYLEFDRVAPNRSVYLDYIKDDISKIEFMTGTYNRITPNSRLDRLVVSDIAISNSIVNDNVSYIEILFPGISDRNFNRYELATISTSPLSNGLYLYNNIGIYKHIGLLNDYNVGDIINISSDVIDVSVMIVNKNNHNGGDCLYFVTNFSEDIVYAIKNSPNLIYIKNLNKYSDSNDLINKFSINPLFSGYKLDLSNDLVLSGEFNEKTSYYNLEAKIITDLGDYYFTYDDSFFDFGYTPTYNILDYLNNIDSNFTPTKEFLAMPIYNFIPFFDGNNSVDSTVWFDSNIETNKLYFGKDLNIEYETFYKWTFIDIEVDGNLIEKVLILDKKYDSDTDRYYLVFNKSLYIGATPSYVSLRSRRSLQKISDDLKELNNIHYNYNTTSVTDKELNYRFPTDSYAKILLCDTSIQNLTSIVYTDYKNELALNMIEYDINTTVDIQTTMISGIVIDPSTPTVTYVRILCNTEHNLSEGDSVVINFTGGSNSSAELNRDYIGYHIISSVDTYSFIISVPYGVSAVGLDPGTVNIMKSDPFIDYIAVDLIEPGIDKRYKVGIEVTPSNVVVRDVHSIENVDMSNYRYRFVDGLNFELVIANYSWLLEAEISKGVIGLGPDGIIWYNGIWHCGRWFGGRWISGAWISGDWYGGIWDSKTIDDKYDSVIIGEKFDNNEMSTWYNGRWYDGVFNNGLWVKGRWYGGTHNNGLWYDGTFFDGIWNGGDFTGGIWVNGTWNQGIFNSSNKNSYWMDGNFYGGEFQNGIWYDGIFDSRYNAKFGTRGTKSKSSIWYNGNFIKGEIFSNETEPNNINTVWKSGRFSEGTIHGGIFMNMQMDKGLLLNGVIEEIQVVKVETDINGDVHRVHLLDMFYFNPGDTLTLIYNDNYYDVIIESSENVIYNGHNVCVVELLAPVFINGIVNTTYTDTGVYAVSNLNNCDFKRGIFYNGVMRNSKVENVVMYNGIVDANTIFGE